MLPTKGYRIPAPSSASTDLQMAPSFIIYGANGYTGRLAADQAKSKGLKFEIAGRSKDKIAKLALALDVPYRIFDTTDAESAIDAALADSQVLLNCAGPFARTAKPLMQACIRNHAHYLDVSAELGTYGLAGTLDAEAKEAGIMLLPGCGGSVAVLGCLAGYAASRVAEPVGIDVALHVAGSMSRGSATSAAESVKTATGSLQRVDGRLVEVDQGAGGGGGGTSTFDFGDGRGSVDCFAVTLPDLITISKATGVANVRTFVNVSGNAFPSGDISSLPDGPSVQEREANPYHASVRVTGRDGTVVRAVLHTVNGYTFTPVASVETARRILSGVFQIGFSTPAAVFGNTFIENAVDGTKIVNL